MFTNAERTQSSTYRELAAILFVLNALRPFLSSFHVKWFTDNQGAARIVQVGSMHFDLHLLASDIFSFCYNYGINLEIDWVPRSLNDKADYLSKIVDFDDWEVVPEIFQFLDSRWGPHTVDCFATFYNFKVPRFFSRFWNPGSSGVDAFFQTWQGENCWVVPPVVLLSKVLRFMYLSRAQGTLVLPYWPSAPFWPLLVRDFWEFVIDYQFFVGALSVRQGRNSNSLLGSPTWSGHIIAVRLVFP